MSASRLFRRMLKAASHLDESVKPAKRALLLSLPKRVWIERDDQLREIPWTPRGYHELLHDFNKGEHYKPVGQKAVDHVRKVWREPGGSIEIAFKALKHISEILKLTQQLPDAPLPVQKKKKRLTPSSPSTLRLSSPFAVPSVSKKQPKSLYDPLQKGKLLVGHPIASLTDPLSHRALVLLDPKVSGDSVGGYILNKDCGGQTLGRALHSNYQDTFGELCKKKLWKGGHEEDTGIVVLHGWKDIPGSRLLAPGVYAYETQRHLLVSDQPKGLVALRERVASFDDPADAPARVVYGKAVWKRQQLRYMLECNHWLVFEARAKSRPAAFQDFCILEHDDAWKEALWSADANTAILTGVPDLASPFGKSYLSIVEEHHQELGERLKQSEHKRNNVAQRKGRGDAGTRGGKKAKA